MCKCNFASPSQDSVHLTRSTRAQDPSVIVQVGFKTWDLSQERLRWNSKYFQDRLHNVHHTHFIQLPNDFDADTFTLFYEWIRDGEYNRKKRQGYVEWSTRNLGLVCAEEQSDRFDAKWEQKACIWAWVMGSKLDAPGFRDYAMREIFEWFMKPDENNSHWVLDAHAAVYACTESRPEHQLLRHFIWNYVYMHFGDVDYCDPGDRDWWKVIKMLPDLRNELRLNKHVSSDDRWHELSDERALENYFEYDNTDMEDE